VRQGLNGNGWQPFTGDCPSFRGEQGVARKNGCRRRENGIVPFGRTLRGRNSREDIPELSQIF